MTRAVLAVSRPLAPNIEVYASTDALKVMASEPAVWVFNHMDFSDPLVVGAMAHRLGLMLPRFAAMAELFRADNPQLANFTASVGGFPLDRELLRAGNKSAVVQLFRVTDYILSELEESLVLFPEGGIHKKPSDYKNKISAITDTAMRIARRNKVPLMVGGLAGTRMLALKMPFQPNRRKVGIALRCVYGHDELPKNEGVLHDSMQKAANVAESVRRG